MDEFQLSHIGFVNGSGSEQSVSAWFWNYRKL